jgi:hypothetical protein
VIRTDGKPTIAWERRALEAGGHLADDVAAVMLDVETESSFTKMLEKLPPRQPTFEERWPFVLHSEDTALD